MKTYSSTEAARLAGLTYRQLDWLCRGLPELGQPTGSGSRRSFSAADIPMLIALRRLRDLGAGNLELRRVLMELRVRPGLLSGWIVVTTDEVRMVSARTMVDALGTTEGARVVRWEAEVALSRRRRERRGVA